MRGIANLHGGLEASDLSPQSYLFQKLRLFFHHVRARVVVLGMKCKECPIAHNGETVWLSGRYEDGVKRGVKPLNSAIAAANNAFACTSSNDNSVSRVSMESLGIAVFHGHGVKGCAIVELQNCSDNVAVEFLSETRNMLPSIWKRAQCNDVDHSLAGIKVNVQALAPAIGEARTEKTLMLKATHSVSASLKG